MNTDNHPEKRNENRDPITGEPGCLPLGTGLGSAGGAAAGAAMGGIGGPIGAAIVGGGGTGHAVAEGLDPTAEDTCWNANYRNEPYDENNSDFNDITGPRAFV